MRRGNWPARVLGGLPRDFLLLWFGQSVSGFGTQLRRIALPTTAIVVFDATPLQISFISLCTYSGLLAFGLPAGIWIDRWDRRRVMLACDAVQTVTLASIPAAFVAGHLSLGIIYAAAAVNGVMDVFFTVAYQSILPSLVPREQLMPANSRLQLGDAGATIAGPSVAGGLLALLSAPLVLLVDAATYLVSVLSLTQLRGGARVRVDGRRGPFLSDLAAGLRVLVGQPVVRATTAAAMASNLGDAAVGAVYLIFAYRVLGLSTIEVGLIWACGNAAGLAAATVAPEASRRLGLGRAMSACIAMTGLCWLLVPLGLIAAAPAVLVAAMTMRGFSSVAWNVMNVSLRQTVTPIELQARVHSAIRVLSWGIVPVGSLLGGGLGSLLSGAAGARAGLSVVIVVGGLIGTSSVVALLAGRVDRIRTIHDAERLVEHA